MHKSRENSYNKIYNYFEYIVNQSKLINGFSGYSDIELRTKINSHNGLKSPFLALWDYKKGYLGENENTKSVISLGYLILRNDFDIEDIKKRYKVTDECERLANHINSRIRFDSNNPDHFLFNSYLKNRTQIDPILMEDLGFGVQVILFLENPLLLKLNHEDWHDISKTC